MKKQVIIKDIDIEIRHNNDGLCEGSISFSAYEDSECRYPSARTYGFAGYGDSFMEVAADFFSIFPVNNTGFIKGRRIEVESDDISKTHIISIKSLDTGRIFDAIKYKKDASNLSDYYLGAYVGLV